MSSKESHMLQNVYCDPRARISNSMSYKHNQQQYSTKTAFLKSTQQRISIQMSTHQMPQLSKAWMTQDLSYKSDHYDLSKNFHHKSTAYEVDTGANCNILPLYKGEGTFGEIIQLGQPTVKMIGHIVWPIKNFGAITVILYHSNKKFCEVADSSSHNSNQRSGPENEICWLPMDARANMSMQNQAIKVDQKEQVKAATKPVRPVIQQSTDSSITINHKTHQLPSPKEYLLKSMQMWSKG